MKRSIHLLIVLSFLAFLISGALTCKCIKDEDDGLYCGGELQESGGGKYSSLIYISEIGSPCLRKVTKFHIYLYKITFLLLFYLGSDCGWDIWQCRDGNAKWINPCRFGCC